MTNIIEICVICAWRESCKKKFSISGRDIHCPDFSEDHTLKLKEKEPKEEKKEGN